jgi:hypothetical protein
MNNKISVSVAQINDQFTKNEITIQFTIMVSFENYQNVIDTITKDINEKLAPYLLELPNDL